MKRAVRGRGRDSRRRPRALLRRPVLVLRARARARAISYCYLYTYYCYIIVVFTRGVRKTRAAIVGQYTADKGDNDNRTAYIMYIRFIHHRVFVAAIINIPIYDSSDFVSIIISGRNTRMYYTYNMSRVLFRFQPGDTL